VWFNTRTGTKPRAHRKPICAEMDTDATTSSTTTPSTTSTTLTTSGGMAQIGDGGTECSMDRVIRSAADCKAVADRLGMTFHKQGSWPVQFGCITNEDENVVWFNTRTGSKPRAHRKPICEPPSTLPVIGDAGTECLEERVIDSFADCETAANQLGISFFAKVGDWPVQFGCVTNAQDTLVFFNTRRGVSPRPHRKPICAPETRRRKLSLASSSAH